MTKTYDIEYRTSDHFTHFFPNSPQGEVVWGEMLQQQGTTCFLNIHKDIVIKQLRNAGYAVGKAKQVNESIEEILKELGE